MIAANCLFTEGTSSVRKSMLQTSIYDRHLHCPVVGWDCLKGWIWVGSNKGMYLSCTNFGMERLGCTEFSHAISISRRSICTATSSCKGYLPRGQPRQENVSEYWCQGFEWVPLDVINFLWVSLLTKVLPAGCGRNSHLPSSCLEVTKDLDALHFRWEETSGPVVWFLLSFVFFSPTLRTRFSNPRWWLPSEVTRPGVWGKESIEARRCEFTARRFPWN